MIRLRDTLALSLTKLRTRKIRLIITIVVSGLLFTALVGASMVGRGAFASIGKFGNEGLGKRYIVLGYNVQNSGNFFTDKTVLDRAIALQKDLVARKKAEAKRLGLDYDPASEPQAVGEFDTPVGKQQNLNPQSAIGKQAIKEYIAAHPEAGQADFEKIAKPYNAKAFYASMMFPYTFDGRLQVLKDGKERFDVGGGAANKFQYGPPTGLDSFPSNWTAMSPQMLDPFVLAGQNLQVGADGSIPIIVPYSAAEELLSLSKLPATATPEQKLERTKQLRADAKNVAFSLCYRNATSQGQIDSAIATQQEIDRNKKNKDYKKPDLMYGLPGEACTPAPVIRDVRSADQKKRDAKQQQFDEMFGKTAATQTTIKFRVVGIVPDFQAYNAAAVDQILGGLVTSSLGSGWFSPIEATLSQPLFASAFEPSAAAATGQRPNFYAEFKTADDARAFMDKQSCTPNNSVFSHPDPSGAQPDPIKHCTAAGTFFSLNPFGSNSLALESLKEKFTKFFLFAALGVAAIGAIIMMGTVGRLIADSRRETAVFRAIGAKRLDIVQIYLVYTALLSLLISAFAIVGGSILAAIAQARFADGLTVQALVAYNARDLDQTFQLYTFYLPDMLLLTGLAMGIGLISIAIPLIRNVRRNPIRDMRDDT